MIPTLGVQAINSRKSGRATRMATALYISRVTIAGSREVRFNPLRLLGSWTESGTVRGLVNTA